MNPECNVIKPVQTSKGLLYLNANKVHLAMENY
jgi:hypothetical protein